MSTEALWTIGGCLAYLVCGLVGAYLFGREDAKHPDTEEIPKGSLQVMLAVAVLMWPFFLLVVLGEQASRVPVRMYQRGVRVTERRSAAKNSAAKVVDTKPSVDDMIGYIRTADSLTEVDLWIGQVRDVDEKRYHYEIIRAFVANEKVGGPGAAALRWGAVQVESAMFDQSWGTGYPRIRLEGQS